MKEIMQNLPTKRTKNWFSRIFDTHSILKK